MEAEPIHPPLLQMEPVIAQQNMPMPLPLNPHNPPGKYFIFPSTLHANPLSDSF